MSIKYALSGCCVCGYNLCCNFNGIEAFRQMSDTETIKKMHDALRALRPSLEKRRKKFRFFLIVGVFFIVLAATAWVFLAHYTRFDMPLVATVSGALIPSFIYYQVINHFYRKRGKAKFLDEVSRAMGFNYKADGLFSLSTVSAHKIIPPCNRESIEDGFEGEYNGVHMTLQEVQLDDLERDPQNRDKKREMKVFHGIFIRLRVRKPFEGHTVIIPNNALMTWFRTKFSNFQKVNLVAPKFEKLYDVMGTDQVESRVIMNPAFIERFMLAGEALRAGYMEVSFLSNEVLIAAARNRPLFEFDPLWQKVTLERLHKKVADIEVVMQLIDILKLNRQMAA